jgi:hypothetical protein
LFQQKNNTVLADIKFTSEITNFVGYFPAVFLGIILGRKVSNHLAFLQFPRAVCNHGAPLFLQCSYPEKKSPDRKLDPTEVSKNLFSLPLLMIKFTKGLCMSVKVNYKKNNQRVKGKLSQCGSGEGAKKVLILCQNY